MMRLTHSHQLGTCAMKPRNEAGVVDARLNVYDVQGLKVVDVSVRSFVDLFHTSLSNF